MAFILFYKDPNVFKRDATSLDVQLHDPMHIQRQEKRQHFCAKYWISPMLVQNSQKIHRLKSNLHKPLSNFMRETVSLQSWYEAPLKRKQPLPISGFQLFHCIAPAGMHISQTGIDQLVRPFLSGIDEKYRHFIRAE